MRALAVLFNDFKTIDPKTNEKCLYLFQCFVNFCHALRNFYREISPGSRDRPLERFWGGDEVQKNKYFCAKENLMKKIHARRVALKILPHWPKGKC